MTATDCECTYQNCDHRRAPELRLATPPPQPKPVAPLGAEEPTEHPLGERYLNRAMGG